MSRPARHLALAGALAALLALPGGAAAHHSVMINEVAASGGTAADFVELQTYRQGQNGVAATQLDVYPQLGPVVSFELTAEVPNGTDQSTILIGASGVAGADFTFPGLGSAMTGAGGAVCFAEATPPDCVGWGSFTVAPALPFPGAGPLAAAIPEGLSLARTHARGCATALDAADDTNSSAADLALGAPTPQPNAATPSEFECTPCGGVDATIVGTDGKETIRGTAGRDVIAAKAGADTLIGLGGDDILCGDIGKDVLKGGKGRDLLIGDRGSDTCAGGPGKDVRRSCERGPKRGPKA